MSQQDVDDVRPVIRSYVEGDLLPDPHGKVVWDLGCGDGRFTAAFLAEGARRVLSSDLHIPDSGAAALMRDDPRIDWLVGGFDAAVARWQAPVPVDIIFMSLMTEHVADIRGFFRELAAICGTAEILVHHDNYFQPVGHHDHRLLFLDPASWRIEPQGVKCWESTLKCDLSQPHRTAMGIEAPWQWSERSEATRSPHDCSGCNYYRRSQPWAHLIYGDDLVRTFPEPFFNIELNRITPDQLKWYVQEAGFRITSQSRSWVSNSVPEALAHRFGAETLTTFTITLRLQRR